MKLELLASVIAGILSVILSVTLFSISLALMTGIRSFAMGFIVTLISIYLAKLFTKQKTL